MTQEHKQLLLKDLSARLPYGVKGRVSCRDCNNRKCEFAATIDGKLYDRFAVAQELWFDNVTIKPFLFPLSSMTEEQCYKLASIRSDFQDCWKYIKTPIPLSICNFEQIDFFHKNHLDYRGLIPLGLAEDATGKNIY